MYAPFAVYPFAGQEHGNDLKLTFESCEAEFYWLRVSPMEDPFKGNISSGSGRWLVV